MEEKACCCAPGRKTKKQDCAICGKPLVYFSDEKQMECAICHKLKPASRPSCAWWPWNNECIRSRFPFFPQKRA